MLTLHVNAAHISISQAYHFIAIYYQSNHLIPFLYKNLILRNINFHVDFTPHRQHSSVAPPATILPVSSQLDLRFNPTELFKTIARAIMLPQLDCIFHKPSSITLIVATVFSKTVANNPYRLIYTSVFSE